MTLYHSFLFFKNIINKRKNQTNASKNGQKTVGTFVRKYKKIIINRDKKRKNKNKRVKLI
jgi:hypothetical protein